MSSLIRFAALVAVLLIIAPAACAPGGEMLASGQPSGLQDGEKTREQPGFKVGEKAPKFTLKDQDGKERSLDEFLKHGKVALMFYRSADW